MHLTVPRQRPGRSHAGTPQLPRCNSPPVALPYSGVFKGVPRRGCLGGRLRCCCGRTLRRWQSTQGACLPTGTPSAATRSARPSTLGVTRACPAPLLTEPLKAASCSQRTQGLGLRIIPDPHAPRRDGHRQHVAWVLAGSASASRGFSETEVHFTIPSRSHASEVSGEWEQRCCRQCAAAELERPDFASCGRRSAWRGLPCHT